MSDQWFDSYGNISWDDEKAHLDNFAIALQQDPNLIGYIIVYAGRRACVGEARDRALRAKMYLVETRGISQTQIKWLDGGYREGLTVILQPVPSRAPELTASPTLKPSEVRIIKNCKPTSRDEHLRGEYRPPSSASGTGSVKIDEYDFIPFQEERCEKYKP